ncbi:MAG: hypothetical protein CME62_09425 [Halobacteriovoraceae bacterium]|nr:hypothetical protein [Halobacteriovoraceae bacterium]
MFQFGNRLPRGTTFWKHLKSRLLTGFFYFFQVLFQFENNLPPQSGQMELELKRINISHANELQKVFEKAPQYALNVDGTNYVPKDSAMRALQALPPSTSYKDKYVFLIKLGNENIGAIDLIRDYPEKDTAYIGLLILCEEMQGKGFGRKAYKALEKYILNELGLGRIQLSYVESNPVEMFWSKNGFYKIGDRKPYEGINRKSFSQKMEKEIMLFHEPQDYQDRLNELFKNVRSDVLKSISLSRFEHIGASSIKGSVSKGDLDIFVGVDENEFQHAREKLKEIGFSEKENTLRTDELCMMVTEKYNHDVALQVVVNGSEFEDFIVFRDFMISRPDLVEELNELKRKCRGLSADEYRSIKSKWVEKILNQYFS